MENEMAQDDFMELMLHEYTLLVVQIIVSTTYKATTVTIEFGLKTQYTI
jgi:hypothetical protein